MDLAVRYFWSASANSSGGLTTTRRPIARKRSIGVRARSVLTAAAAAALSFSSVARRRGILARQFCVGQPPPSDRRRHLAEADAVIVLALIKPKRLLIEISAEMERLYRDVGAFDGPLQEGPEVFDAVRMRVVF